MPTLRQPIVQILAGLVVLLVAFYVLSKGFLSVLFIITISAYVIYTLFDVSLYRHGSTSESTMQSQGAKSEKMIKKASLNRSVSSAKNSHKATRRGPLTLNNSMNTLSESYRIEDKNFRSPGSHHVKGNRLEMSKSTSPYSPGSLQHSSNSGFQFEMNVSGSMNRSGRSFLTSPFTGHSPSSTGRSAELQLPRVRRVSNSSPSFSRINSPVSGRPPIASHKRYPIHQPRFDTVGILPAVKLHSPSRNLISEQSPSLFGAVTVKVAPPDVLKPPTPIIIKVNKKPQPTGKTDSVLTALREKRKRTVNEEEEQVQATSPSSQQLPKRRRQIEEDDPVAESANGGVGMEVSSRVATKRSANADDEQEEKGDLQAPKRTRTTSGSSSLSVGSSGQQCTRNAIDISYSSSIRWRERQGREQSFSRSRESSFSGRQQAFPRSDRVTRSKSRDRAVPKESNKSSSRPVSRRNSPIRLGQVLRDLRDGDETMGEPGTATSTPVPCSSGRSTPASFAYTGSDVEESFCRGGTPKKKLVLLKKEGSSKRRLAPPHSDLATSFAKAPQLRYSLTVEDFERDRHAEMERVNQMMNEVEQAHKEQLERRAKLKETRVPATSLSSTSANTTTVNTSTTVGPGVAPLSAGFSLSSSITASSTTLLASKLTTNSVSSKPLTTGGSLASSSASDTETKTTTSKSSSDTTPQTGVKDAMTAPNAIGGFKYGETIKSTSEHGGSTSKAVPIAGTMTFGGVTSSVSASQPPATTSVTTTLFSHTPSASSTTASIAPTSASNGMFSFDNSTKSNVLDNTNTGSSLPSYGAATLGTSTTLSTSSILSGGFVPAAAPTSTIPASSAVSSSSTAGIFGAASFGATTASSASPKPSATSTNDFLFGEGSSALASRNSSFKFGASPTLTSSKSSPNFGSLVSNPASTSSNVTPGFGFGSSKANPDGSMFGGPPVTSTNSTGLTFGSTVQPTTATPSSGLAFGSSTTSAGGTTFSFGKIETATSGTVGSGFSFGQQTSSSNKPAAGGAFQFGQSAQGSSGSTLFNQPAKNPTLATPGFGQSITNSSSFNTPSTQTTLTFGSGTGAAKQPTSSSAFQFGQTKPLFSTPSEGVFGNSSTGPFGAAGQSQTSNAGIFGSSSQSQGQSSVFGQSGGTSQSTFGSGNTNPGQEAFGSGSSQGVFSFGQQNPTSVNTQDASKGFNFGASSTGGLPTPNFNFIAGSSGQTPGGNPAPAFSTPPNPGMGYGAPGGFSIGQSNTAPQKRTARVVRRGQRPSSRR